MLLTACVAASLSAGALLAQTANPSSAQSPYYGSVTTVQATGAVENLSLDDAIQMGIRHNLALVEAHSQEEIAKGQSQQKLQTLLPYITAQADSGSHQINLAAEGFTPNVLTEIAPLFPQISFAGVSTIVEVNVTDAMLNYSETLFSLTSFDQYRASKESAQAAFYASQSSRGLVVLNVGSAYLQAVALGAQVENARALLRADQVLLNQSVEEHSAGTAANLDVLRAQVQLQTQQQSLIDAENNFEKAKIALNREIGLPAEQLISLTDATPYSELETMDIGQARQEAYRSRQDYQGLQSRIRAAQLERRAAKWERLPQLDFDGNYGVTGITGGVYHGTFLAEGSLHLPIFEEAKFRADRDVAEANLGGLMQQLANLREQIDQQLRDSMLDLQSRSELVRVATSNVALAQQELEQATERFAAGVDDDLPVVEAQAALAGAEANLVNTTAQFNLAKLGLARNLGIVDTQYKTFLHGK